MTQKNRDKIGEIQDAIVKLAAQNADEKAPHLITFAEARAILGISKATCYCWARDGKLPGAVRINAVWRVDKAVLLRAIGR